MIPWIIALLFAISFGGLAFVLLRAMFSGAEAYASTYSVTTARQFEDLFVFVPPRRIAEAGWASAATAFILVFMLTAKLTSALGISVGLVLGGGAAALAFHTPRYVLRVLKRRRLRRFNLQLTDTLVSMSNALKAGFSIAQAFESVVRDGQNPIAQEFAVFLQQTRVGVSFSEALANLDERVGSEDLTLVVMAIETARKTGGNLTEILEKISATIRERLRIENRIRTLTAQGRLQGIIVSAMPLVIGAAMMLVDPGMMIPFLHSLMGLVIIVVVAALIVSGGLIIRKIVNIDV
jgi:tight adherence protein B